MKTTELRIGNWVNYGHGRDPQQITSQDIHLGVEDRPFEPIGLTSEWLEKFGFKFVDMMFENVPMRYWRKDFLIVEQSKVVFLYNDKEVVTTVNVGFVHQLQNLHFVLNGSEL